MFGPPTRPHLLQAATRAVALGAGSTWAAAASRFTFLFRDVTTNVRAQPVGEQIQKVNTFI